MPIDRRALIVAILAIVPRWLVTGVVSTRFTAHRRRLVIEWTERGDRAVRSCPVAHGARSAPHLGGGEGFRDRRGIRSTGGQDGRAIRARARRQRAWGCGARRAPVGARVSARRWYGQPGSGEACRRRTPDTIRFPLLSCGDRRRLGRRQ